MEDSLGVNITVQLADGSVEEYWDTDVPFHSPKHGQLTLIERDSYSVGRNGTLTITRVTWVGKYAGDHYRDLEETAKEDIAHYRPPLWVKAHET